MSYESTTTDALQPTPAPAPSSMRDTTPPPSEMPPPADTTPGLPGSGLLPPSPGSTAPPANWPPSTLPGAGNPLPGGSTALPTAKDSGLLTIWVPYDAKVWVNGMETKSTGSRRQYVSFGLKQGFSYRYEVKAQIVREGQLVEDIQDVVLTAGSTGAVAFGFNRPAAESVALANK
ncbi:MAG: TIGR03000 domain-containing protein [Planctomycetota bacterium]